MKLCRDASCEYCLGGIRHNHLVEDGARRTIVGRVVRWARVAFVTFRLRGPATMDVMLDDGRLIETPLGLSGTITKADMRAAERAALGAA